MQDPLRGTPFARRTGPWIALSLAVLTALVVVARIPKTLSVFVVAGFIALGVHPVTSALERRMPRPLAITIVYFSLLTALAVLVLLIFPATLAQVQTLTVDLPSEMAAWQSVADQVGDFLHMHFGKELPIKQLDVQSFVGARLEGLATAAFASLGLVLYNAVAALVVGLSALVLSWFFLLRFDAIGESLVAFFPAERQPAVRVLSAGLVTVFGRYVAGQSVLCFVVGVAIYAALLALHFQFALVVGVLGGVAYAVPLFGMLAVHVLAAVLAIPQGMSTVLWVTAAIFVICRVADSVLVPQIMAESIGVSPIAIMFSVFAGGELFGLPGLLLGIPAAAFVRLIWQFVMTPELPVATEIVSTQRDVKE